MAYPTPVPAAAPELRAKYLRTERPRVDGDEGRTPYAAADVFNRACNLWEKHHGGSNASLARWLGLSESIVRRWRSGEKVVTLARLLRCPPELVRCVTRLLSDEIG